MHFAFHFTLGILSRIHDLSRTQHFSSHLAQHVFCEIHQVIKVGVGLIELQHGELRIMSRGQTFIAEVAVDLVDALKATHYQTLQIKLRRNTQVHINIQRIMVSHKRTCHSTTRNNLQHWGFNF